MNRALKNLQFFKKLKQLSFIDAILLYGSRARNDHQERSDIDIAISCPNATQQDWLNVISIIDDADTLLKIDCIKLESLTDQNPLKQRILSEGIYLYKNNEKL